MHIDPNALARHEVNSYDDLICNMRGSFLIVTSQVTPPTTLVSSPVCVLSLAPGNGLTSIVVKSNRMMECDALIPTASIPLYLSTHSPIVTLLQPI